MFYKLYASWSIRLRSLSLFKIVVFGCNSVSVRFLEIPQIKSHNKSHTKGKFDRFSKSLVIRFAAKGHLSMAPLRDNYTYDGLKLMNETLLKIMAFHPKTYPKPVHFFFHLFKFAVQTIRLAYAYVSFSLLSECVQCPMKQRPTRLNRVRVHFWFYLCMSEFAWMGRLAKPTVYYNGSFVAVIYGYMRTYTHTCSYIHFIWLVNACWINK